MSNRTVNRYDPLPSIRARVQVSALATPLPVDREHALAVPVAEDAAPPAELDLDAAALRSAGFRGARGQTLVLPGRDGILRVAVGVGSPTKVDRTLVRESAAEFARAVPQHRCLVVELPASDLGISIADYAQAATEGVLLARWRFTVAADPEPTLESLVLLGPAEDLAAAEEGARRGQAVAEAYNIGRDLANCPAATLTAVRMAELATELGATAGFDVEIFDKDALVEMGCGGILGVNMGSVDPPRLIRLRYTPGNPTGRLALIGKGIMYDSGGISLKPSDESHAQMKNDMTGAAAILGAMTALRTLGCPTAVTAYLCCTDNMPSGSAMKLGDVLTMRNGMTVEVLNTDAEGRLVMADGLALAVEEPVDAVVDIATLTGACLRTFGVEIAGVMGNNPQLIGQLRRAGEAADEPVWELPLHRPYRRELESAIADMTNMGGPNAGSITAALFLEEFVDGHPWAHIDIAGTAQLPAPRGWRNKGATGSGGMLLIELAMGFRSPAAEQEPRSTSS
jgi:leucyl aminopeptidase